jgi:mutator family transposase/pRiA4b ORF-3-like protein
VGRRWQTGNSEAIICRHEAPSQIAGDERVRAVEADTIVQVKIWLDGVSPMTWRRVRVPGSITLRELHGVIQVVMGWEGLHLYQFPLRTGQYGSSDLGASSPEVSLTALRLRQGARLVYQYDLNIPWRHLGTPALAVIDGNPGLHAALRAQWPEIAIQRCTNHKLRNLLAKAPAHLREELAEDYRRLVYAETREAVTQARASFLRKWRLRCKAVVSSFEAAGDELFTFLQFPQSQWKALRTTNAPERINEEFRRRTKTQASFKGSVRGN